MANTPLHGGTKSSLCWLFALLIVAQAAACARLAPVEKPTPVARDQIPEHPQILPVGRWVQDGEHPLLARYEPQVTPAALVRRGDVPDRPLSELGPPNFPPEYPSCVKCEERYSSISSCMRASSVFANATSIFNDPISYIAVIKCACTDTFQAVYPQCVDCFQHTDQCWYLGTDPQGTGAPQLITNIRQICGFGSALLGGVAGANGMNNSQPASAVPTYTDVTQT